MVAAQPRRSWGIETARSRNDTHGIQLQTLTAERGGQRITIKSFGAMHFTDGKVTEAWFIDEDPYTADAWFDAGLK